MHVCTPHACPIPVEVRRGRGPGDDYVTRWMMGPEPGFFAKAVSVLTLASSLQLLLFLPFFFSF